MLKAQSRLLLIWQSTPYSAIISNEIPNLHYLDPSRRYRERERRARETGERGAAREEEKAFLWVLHGSCMRNDKPIIFVKFSFFSQLKRSGLPQFKKTQIKTFRAIHAPFLCWMRTPSVFFFTSFSSPLLLFSILVIKFERNQMGRGGSMKVPFVGLKRASNLQNALPLCARLKEKRNQ